MSAVGRSRAALTSGRPPGRRVKRLPEEATARLAATTLWVVVGLATIGGVTAWLRPSSAPVVPGPATVDDRPAGETWVAAVAAERFVAAYLEAGPDAIQRLASFLAYDPELSSLGDEVGELEGPVEVVRHEG